MTEKIDRLFSNEKKTIRKFEFSESVADVFPDMINRSVPGYDTTLRTIGLMAARFAQAGTRCFDLGCSLGAASLAMGHCIDVPDVSIVAVDNSQAMVRKCRNAIQRARCPTPVEVRMEDARASDISNASVVVMNFTLQFIPQADRNCLIRRIYDGLVDGGVLIVSEKISFADPSLNQQMIELHHEFKRANGYSDLEISQKREALEDVLITETFEQHCERLSGAGFSSQHIWFQCFNFVSLLARRQD